MEDYVVKRLALVLAVQAEIEAMKADNERYKLRGIYNNGTVRVEKYPEPLEEQSVLDLLEVYLRLNDANIAEADKPYWEIEVDKDLTFINKWYSRNPSHDINSNTGKDMFFTTARMVAEDYTNLLTNNTQVDFELVNNKAVII